MKVEDCRECGANAVVPIAYGLPDLELAQRAERGEVVIGGCVIDSDAPSHVCTRCGTEVHEDAPPDPSPNAVAWIYDPGDAEPSD